jgi:hypothetical protein
MKLNTRLHLMLSCTSCPSYICVVHGQFCLIQGQIHVKCKLGLMRYTENNKITEQFLTKDSTLQHDGCTCAVAQT